MKSAIITITLVAILTVLLPSAQAARLDYTGIVESTTAAFDQLTPVGTLINGYLDVTDASLAGGVIGPDDINAMVFNLEDIFCFSLSSGDCTGGVFIQIVATNSAGITNTAGVLGGALLITAFAPTAMIQIDASFDLDNSTFFADSGGLGSFAGTGNFAIVPVPPAVWLFLSALGWILRIRV